MLSLVDHLHEVNAFGEITNVVVFALEVFERFNFFTHQVEYQYL